MTGMISNVKNALVSRPPTMGAAIRFITSAPLPVAQSSRMRPMSMVETVISFGDEFETSVPILCPTLVSPNRIEGFAPPGLGAVAVWAKDPVSGSGNQLDLAFTYLTEDSPDGSSVAAPQTCPDGGIP